MEKEYEKIVIFRPAFDKRTDNPSTNYGIGGVRCIMVLKGKDAAVHFSFGTGMYLKKTISDWLFQFPKKETPDYMGYDVGYHDIKPHFEGQGISQEHCEWLDGRPCYCDGSALRAEEFMDVLVEKGSDEIWKMLEEDLKNL